MKVRLVFIIVAHGRSHIAARQPWHDRPVLSPSLSGCLDPAEIHIGGDVER